MIKYRLIPLIVGTVFFIVGGAVIYFGNDILLCTVGVAIIWVGWRFFFKVVLFGRTEVIKKMCEVKAPDNSMTDSEIDNAMHELIAISESLTSEDRAVIKMMIAEEERLQLADQGFLTSWTGSKRRVSAKTFAKQISCSLLNFYHEAKEKHPSASSDELYINAVASIPGYDFEEAMLQAKDIGKMCVPESEIKFRDIVQNVVLLEGSRQMGLMEPEEARMKRVQDSITTVCSIIPEDI